jgi:hypothetical protein
MQSYPTLSWKALYQDGTLIEESPEVSSENIDRDKLKEFYLCNTQGAIVFAGFFNPNKKLIFRKRTFMNNQGETLGIVYLVGWHEKIGKGSVKTICYLYPDGHIELDDSREDLALRPCEEFNCE